MKMLYVTMPDESVWAVPAQVIAENRARYYATHDPDPDYETTYRTEMEYTLGDNSALEDWAADSMNWSDVEDHARRVDEPPTPDYEEGWINGEKRVVEVDDPKGGEEE